MTLAVVECASCNMDFGVTQMFQKARRNDHKVFYCPKGCHNYYSGDSEEEKLRKQLETQRQQNARAWDAAREAEERAREEKRRAAAARGQVTKIKKRVGGGVCPCCNRTFENLANHMKSKHAGFATESEA